VGDTWVQKGKKVEIYSSRKVWADMGLIELPGNEHIKKLTTF
jgi:hypothetical protein